MTTWPASLPPPSLNTFKESPPNNVIRSSMDKGPDKTRHRTSANIRPISFTLKLTPAQVTTLDDFYVANDALEFDYTHPRTGVLKTARFIAPPDYMEVEGVIYTASLQLEILP